jgi:hypothetical protein
VEERLAGTLATSARAVEAGADMVRVHDVQENVQLIRMWKPLREERRDRFCREIFIALGSNLGDRAGNILRALALMKARGIKIRKVSDFIETKPYGVTDQPDFLNAVVRVETGLGARTIGDKLCWTGRNNYGQSAQTPLGRAQYRFGLAVV